MGLRTTQGTYNPDFAHMSDAELFEYFEFLRDLGPNNQIAAEIALDELDYRINRS